MSGTSKHQRLTLKSDGTDHINIYSDGQTELGRFLSNFSYSPFECEDGKFNSVEGYWYWLSCRDSKKEVLRTLYGYQAKKVGRELRGIDWDRSPEFKKKIQQAIKAKLESNPSKLDELRKLKVPLTHYYLFNGKRKFVPEADWIVDFLESYKREDPMKNFDFEIVGADTDGLAFKKKDQKQFTDDERKQILDSLNAQMDALIRWEDDGVMKRQIVVKTKNYILVDQNNKVKIKGSALKATTKEKALQKFIRDVIELLIKDRLDQLFFLYLSYVRQIVNLKDISDWCSKKTVTKAVLTSERTNEVRVRKALEGTTVQEGDKIYTFFKTPEELCLRENFDGTYDTDALLSKLKDSLGIFSTIIQSDLFPDFSLKRNRSYIDKISPTEE